MITRLAVIQVTSVLAINALAGAVTLALRRLLEQEIDRVPFEAWSMYFTVLGVIYAITTGFILAELLGRFRRLSTQVREEVNAVEEVRDYLIYVDENEDAKKRIVNAVDNYLDSVVDREWPLMQAEAVTDDDTDTSPEIYDLMEAVETIEIHDQSDVIALEAIIQHLGDITTYRTERLEMSRSHISPRLRLLIAFLSVVIVIGFMLLNIDSALIHAFMVAAVVTTVYTMWLVISDLRRPFWGIWNISESPFRRVVEGLDKDLKRVANRTNQA